MKKIFSLGLLLVAALALVGCSGTNSVAASTIAIDVNPSLVLELDEDDKVMNVIMNNEDAIIIVGDMDLIGVDYNVAVNALIGSMVSNGYLNELANSVLLSIQSNDSVRETELMANLTQAINDVLTGASIDGSVITQELDFEQDAEDLSELLGISEAKAELILDIIEVDPRLTVEELAELSINDLNLLLESKNIVLDNVEKTGNASELGIITVEEAYQYALTQLGLDELAVLKLKVELDQEDGTMVYKVKIETDTDEYKVYIDAKEGTVFVKENDDHDDDDDYFTTEALSEEAVMEIIATELGIDITLVTELDFDQEQENGISYYEVEFYFNGMEYELDVDAETGEIYSNSMDNLGFDYHGDDHDDEMDHEDEDDDEMDHEDEDDDEMDHEDEDDSNTTTDPVTDPTTELPVFTLDELATYTGANGSLAYIAVNGIVYDATSIFNNGQHQGIQIGGTDATTVFASSPHSASLLESLEIVGTLE